MNMETNQAKEKEGRCRSTAGGNISRRSFLHQRAVAAGAAIVALTPARNLVGAEGQAGPQRLAENWMPVDKMYLYLCAFHVAKMNTSFQVEAHHYCSHQTEDLHQCVIYNGRGPDAKILGIEYIITDSAYGKLPAGEKKYWHPHAYEILSGQLIAPDLPKQGDDAFPGFLKTWGKTWHVWPDPSTEMPVGEPLLMWSANGDGQLSDKLIESRDKQFGISTAEIRGRRKAYGYAVPNMPPSKSVDELGHIWSATGPDEPTRLVEKK